NPKTGSKSDKERSNQFSYSLSTLPPEAPWLETLRNGLSFTRLIPCRPAWFFLKASYNPAYRQLERPTRKRKYTSNGQVCEARITWEGLKTVIRSTEQDNDAGGGSHLGIIGGSVTRNVFQSG